MEHSLLKLYRPIWKACDNSRALNAAINHWLGGETSEYGLSGYSCLYSFLEYSKEPVEFKLEIARQILGFLDDVPSSPLAQFIERYESLGPGEEMNEEQLDQNVKEQVMKVLSMEHGDYYELSRRFEEQAKRVTELERRIGI